MNINLKLLSSYFSRTYTIKADLLQDLLGLDERINAISLIDGYVTITTLDQEDE